MSTIKVFLTGAGGLMGGSALELFCSPEQKKRVELVILDLPTPANKAKLLPYEQDHGVQIIWGDLTCYEDVLQGVTGADYVLHAAAVIPPLADHDPDLATRVNIGAAENIVKAIKAQPNPDAVKLVNIGSVAETGDRLPPVHVGRVGDPIMPSMYDMYACTKIAAELAVAESGLKYWVSLRQTFILIEGTEQVPIMFHMPLNTCFEACSVLDAGRVLVNVTKPDLPEDFWRRFYNISSGSRARSTFLEFLRRSVASSGLKLEEVYERSWFALRNFHCQWYEDGDILNTYLDFRQEGLAEHFERVEKKTSAVAKFFTRLVPKSILKNRVFRPVATQEVDSPGYWIENNPMRAAAFFDGQAGYDAIPEWGVDMPEAPRWGEYLRLNHGYDETKPNDALQLADLRTAAVFRGGKCLAEEYLPGGFYHKVPWSCAFGHTFEMTPNAVLKGGHWCPECSPPGWNYDEQARHNPFIAQVWYAHHSPDEQNDYPEDCVHDLKPRL